MLISLLLYSWIICSVSLCIADIQCSEVFFVSAACCLVLLSLKLVIIYPAHSAARFNPCPSSFLNAPCLYLPETVIT